MQNAGMKAITIRNVPDDVRDSLAKQAAQAGRSMQEHLLAELTQLAERPSMVDLMARIRSRKEATGSLLAAETVAEYRAADKR